MKRKVLGIVAAVMVFTGSSIYAFNGFQDECPDKGTAKCKLIKNCPDKGTPECKLVAPKKSDVPPCCQKAQKAAAFKNTSAKQ